MDEDYDYSPAHLDGNGDVGGDVGDIHVNPDPFETTGFGLYNVSLYPARHISFGTENDFSVNYFVKSHEYVKVLVSNKTNTPKDYEIVIEPDEEYSNGGEELYGLYLANVPPYRALFSKNIQLNFDQQTLTMYIYQKSGRGQGTLVFKAPINVSDYRSDNIDEFKQPKSGPIPKFYQEY